MSTRNNKRCGQTLAEYGVIIAGVLVVSLAALTIFGDKVSDLWATAATILPGAQDTDNGPIIAGALIEHTAAGAGPMGAPITIDLTASTGVVSNNASPRLGINLFGDPLFGGQGGNLTLLVVDA